MSSYLSFESDRLYLRPTTEEDAALVLAILTAPKALKFIGDRNLHNEEDAREASKRIMQAAKERFGQLKLSAITHGENTASIKILAALGFAHLGQKTVAGYDGPSEYFEVAL